MSYILEAIKKAESERGETRLYEANHADTSQQVVKPIPWIAIAIFINAAILLTWIGIQIFSSDNNNDEKVVLDALNDANIDRQSEVVVSHPSKESVIKNFEGVSVEATNDDSLEPIPVLKEVIKEPVMVTPKPRIIEPINYEVPVTKRLAIEEIVVREEKVIPAKVAPLPNHGNLESRIDEEVMVKDDTVSPDVSAKVQVDRAIPIVENANVPSFHELPYPLQQKIPDISISVHIYNVAKSARKVRVNGKLLHQGDTVVDDLLIQEITTYGVIFNYEGELFKMTLR